MNDPAASRFPTWLGIAQGALLYALYKSHRETLWPPESGWLFNAVLLSALLLPFVAYWGQGVLSRTASYRLLLGVGALVFSLGAYQGGMVFPLPDATRPQLAPAAAFFGLSLVSFMLVPLVSGWARGKPDAVLDGWDYPRLFEHAWRNAVITLQAGALTCLFWGVLALGAQLFHLIGVDWPKRTIEESWFAIPVTTLSIALGLRSGLRRAAFTVTLRNHWLTLTVWLLPVASLIGSAFVFTSLAGVDKLFERGLSAFFLLWFAAFWITFFNSAFQDGRIEPALNRILRRVLPVTALALLAVAALAAWALGLRILQHGLTPDRIWGVLAAAVALAYGTGYALSVGTGARARWMPSIAPANIVATLLMSSGIVLLLSPALDANRLATNNQMARLESGWVLADDFDVVALAQQERSGHDALTALMQRRGADGKTGKLALRAEDALNNAGRYRDRGLNQSDKQVADLSERIDSYPTGRPIPAGFADFLEQDVKQWESWQRAGSCFALDQVRLRCLILMVDLDRDGQDEVVLWKTPDEFQPEAFAQSQGQWKRIGHLIAGDGGASDSLRAELATGAYAVQPLHWDALRVGKFRFQVVESIE